jgi:two-component system response regulator AtoC
MRLLLDYSWHGNVRELANVIEYAVTVAGRETILPEDLPEELKRPPVESYPIAEKTSRATHSNSNDRTIEAPVEDLEAARIRSVLDAHKWKREEAARALGISRATLWRRMRELRLA